MQRLQQLMRTTQGAASTFASNAEAAHQSCPAQRMCNTSHNIPVQRIEKVQLKRVMFVKATMTHSGAALHAYSVGAVPGHVNALSASCWPVLLWASVSDL